MRTRQFILLLLLVLAAGIAYSQQPISERLDTTISIFWNPNLKLRIHILDPDEPDIRKKNAVLDLYSIEQGPQRILFRDSIFAYTLLFRLMDLDGDGIKDLLVYNANNGPENRSYHLYLVDQKNGRLIRVKGFERLFNPYYDQGHCVIIAFESFETKLNLNRFLVDRKGNLSMVGW